MRAIFVPIFKEVRNQQNVRYTPEMMRNAKIDSNQYERYREVLKEDAGSLADFRQMKYNEPEKFGNMSDPKTGKLRSGVTVDDISEALKTLLDVRTVKTDRQGRRSQKYIGKYATVTVNPDSGILLQCNPTDAEYIRRIKNAKV